MYGQAKEESKYWCLIITNDFIFVYHFTPGESISFDPNNKNIQKFIKYLDHSTLNRFIIRLRKEVAHLYFREEKDIDINGEYVYGGI